MESRFAFEKPDNLVELFETAVGRWPDNKLFGVKTKGGGSLEWSTYRQIGNRVDRLRAGLSGLGVKKGDAVGIIANNRPEWAVAAFATYGLGARYIPMYEAELVKVWKYIITDSSVKVLFVSRPDIYSKIKDFPNEIKTLEHIFLIDSTGDNTMAALEETGGKKPVPSIRPDPMDVAVLIYTSGTTGEPKGVLLSHGNMTSNAIGGNTLYKEMMTEDARSISILPWAHSYGQTAELYNWFLTGGSIGFMEKVDTLADDINLVQPSFIIAVPRVFNRIYDRLWATMKKTGGMKLRLFEAAVETARKRRELADSGGSSLMLDLKFKVLDKLVFEKIRARFGGRLKGALTASATMNVEIAHFFWDIGIPIFDAYGLTETSPAVTMNGLNAYRLGSVGKPIPGVRVVIDKTLTGEQSEDGEIVVYGPNVMQGYNNKPNETAAVLDEAGGFHTGDRGRLDKDGFLFITGRIKEQYKLENGKYVFPAGLEEEIKLVPCIANAMIFGEGKPYNVCLVYPDPVMMGHFARERGLPGSLPELMKTADARDYVIKEIVKALTDKVGSYEIPKKFIFLDDDFTLENGMLTQTMKLKRRVVIDKYKQQIEDLYK
jgi:long-chain acyl-CoA synthetase